MAPTGVPTTGVPHARASAVTRPNPSYATVGTTKRSAARYQSTSSSSLTRPINATRPSSLPTALALRDRSEADLPRDRDAKPVDVSEVGGCVDELLEAHAMHEPADGQDQHLVCWDAKALTCVLSVTRPEDIRVDGPRDEDRALRCGTISLAEERAGELAQNEDPRCTREAQVLIPFERRLDCRRTCPFPARRDPGVKELDLEWDAGMEYRDEWDARPATKQAGGSVGVMADEDVELASNAPCDPFDLPRVRPGLG